MTISDAAAEALEDLLGARAARPPEADPAALLRLALGIADAAERLALAQAFLASPGLRARYARTRAQALGQLGPDPLAASPEEAGARASRLVREGADVARGIGRDVAEGRWSAASEVLRRRLPELREAWRLAGALRRWEEAEALVRDLAPLLVEAPSPEDFAEAALLGYRASDALGRPGLRSLLLSLEGVRAARRGDPERARELWEERASLNRRLGNRAAEADARLDVLRLLGDREDRAAFAAAVDGTERAVAASGRADMEAGFWAVLADERRRAGDVGAALEHAGRALETLGRGEVALGPSLGVRHSAALALAAGGRAREALGALADALETCLESGRAVAAALALMEIGPLLADLGDPALGARCLRASLGVHLDVGTRHVEAARSRLAAIRASSGGAALPAQGWEGEARGILARLRDFRPAGAPS